MGDAQTGEMLAATPRISTDSIKKLYSLREQGVDNRRRYESLWKDIAKYVNPSMSDWEDEPCQNRGSSLPNMKDVYDNTAMLDSSDSADGMQTYGFSRTTTWLRIVTEDPELAEVDEVKQWGQRMEEHCYQQLSKSTYYDEGRSMVRSLQDFGTGVMTRAHDKARGLPIYTSHHLKRVVIMDNEVGEVDVLFRDLWLYPFEAALMFGKDRLPQKIRDAIDQAKLRKWRFTQFIFPLDRFDLDIERRSTKGMPFYSLYCAEQDKTPLREGGYEVKPFWACRHSRSLDGDVWGVDCPGMLELSNVKQLNGMRADRFRVSQATARPPLKATEQLRGRLRLEPNGVTYLRPGEDFAATRVQGDLRPLTEDIQAMQQSIHDSYHRNLFLLLSQNIERLKTATEVEGLKGEQAAMLAAFFGRLTTEFLECSVEDLVQIELDTGRAPPPPEVLAGRKVKIDLVSPLAQLQKRYLLLDSTRAAIGEIVAFAQAKAQAMEAQSDVMDRIDDDAYVDVVADRYHMNRRVLRDMAEVQRIRQARAKQRSAMMQMQMAEQQAKTQATAYGAASKAPEKGSPAAARMGAK